MSEVASVIQQYGFGVFLTGLITCILIGIIKTPIRSKVIPNTLEANEKTRRETIFDTTVFLSTFVIAFLGAMVAYPIINGSFRFVGILIMSLSVWSSQSLCYGIWKKGSVKKGLRILAKLFIKDTNKDGEISLNEAIEQVKGAYKNGKLKIDTLLVDVGDNINENFGNVVEELVEASEITKEQEAVAKAANGDSADLVNVVKESVDNIVKNGSDKKESDDVVVNSSQIIDIK